MMVAPYAGDTMTLRFHITDSEGEPVNLIGSSIRWVLALSPHHVDNPVVLKTNEPDGGVEIFGLGIFDVFLTPEDTRRPGIFHQEVYLIEADGHASHPISERFEILPASQRSA